MTKLYFKIKNPFDLHVILKYFYYENKIIIPISIPQQKVFFCQFKIIKMRTAQ